MSTAASTLVIPENLDSPETTEAHNRLIRSKPFLRKIYEDYYRFLATRLNTAAAGPCIEIGSGGGFIRDLIPDVICSDLVRVSSVQMTFSALELPFQTQSLGAICMINVLHHLARPRSFFAEASRCLMPGGKVLMIEPAHTQFSRFIFQNFHHEPFVPEQQAWELPPGGRMTSANDALPWIIFSRDRDTFEREFPELRIAQVNLIHPLRYLISGGLSRHSLLPAQLYPAVDLIERLISPLNPLLAMFMQIELQKNPLPTAAASSDT